MKQKLSENEREVLKSLIKDGRARCTDMARRLGISSQAVGKIKDKLERRGFIRGYSADADYRRLGIDVFAIAFFRFKSGSWGKMEERDLRERVSGPHLVRVYRISKGDFTHMVVYGFRSVREMEHYFHRLQKQRGHVSELKRYYVLSADSVMKDSMDDLLLKAIGELGRERLAEPEAVGPVLRKDLARRGFFS